VPDNQKSVKTSSCRNVTWIRTGQCSHAVRSAQKLRKYSSDSATKPILCCVKTAKKH